MMRSSWFHHSAVKAFALALLLLSGNFAIAGDQVITGDSVLDASLEKINQRFKNRRPALLSSLSQEYLVPPNKLENLAAIHDFTAADIFLIVAIADISGQPINVISRAFIEHKSAGWPYVLEQLEIELESSEFDQLKEDASMFD